MYHSNPDCASGATLSELNAARVHLVRTGKDGEPRAPIEKGWERRSWNLKGEYMEVGWIPGRSDCALVDLDPKNHGPLEPLEAKTIAALGEPCGTLDTPSGGRHLIYPLRPMKDAREAVSNRKLTVGDLRGDKGQAIMWGEAGKRAVLAAIRNEAGVALRTRAELMAALTPLLVKKARTLPDGNVPSGSSDEPVDLVGVLANAKPGGIHNALVAAVTSVISRGGGHDELDRLCRVYTKVSTDADPERKFAQVVMDQQAWVAANPSRPWLPLDDKGRVTVAYSPGGYWNGLQSLGIDVRFEARRKQLEFKGDELKVNERTHGIKAGVNGWICSDNALNAFIRDLMARKCVYLRETKEGKKVVPFRLGRDAFHEYVWAIVHQRRVDSFRDWLDQLPEWDGRERLDHVFEDLFYVPEPETDGHLELIQWASRAVPMTVVARTYRPGAKVDEVAVLIGPQGCGKSAYGYELLPPDSRDIWHTDAIEFNGRSKEQAEAMKGRVVVEFSEMVGLTKADLGKVKSFVSRLDDGSIRMAFRPDPEQTPRMCAFLMTSNVEKALPNDESGNRRFVTVRLDPTRNEGRLAVEAYMAPIREQLWAEARHRVLVQGEAPSLPRHLLAVQQAVNERHRFHDAPVEDAIAEVFPKGIAYPGVTLEQVALLTDFNLLKKERDRESGEWVRSYKPWAQVVNRDGNRLRQALLAARAGKVVWEQTERKRRAFGDGPAYRWFTTNDDAPAADAFVDEARLRKHRP